MSRLLLRLVATLAFVLIPTFVFFHFVPVPSEAVALRASGEVYGDFFTWGKVWLVILAGILSLTVLLLTLKKHFTGDDLKFLSLFLLATGSILFSQTPTLAWWGLPGFGDGGWFYLSCILLSWAFSRGPRVSIHWPLVLGFFLVTVLGLLQVAQWDYLSQPWIRELLVRNPLVQVQVAGSPFSTLMNVNYVGSYLSLCIPFLLACSLVQRRKWFLFFVLLGFILLIYSGSRAGLLGAILGSLWAILTFFKKKPHWKLLSTTALFVLLISAGIYFQNPTHSPWNHFSAEGGTVRVVYENKGFQITGNHEQIRVAQLGGKPIRLKNDEESFLFNEVGFEEFRIIPKFQGKPFSYFIVSIDGADLLPLAMTPKGIQVFSWGSTWDSEVPKRVPWLLDERLGSSRLYIWTRTVPLLRKSLLLGRGPGAFALDFPQRDFFGKLRVGWPVNMYIDRPHSFFFQVWHATGLLSLLLILWLSATAVKRSTPQISGAIIGFLISGFFTDGAVGVAPIFWSLLGLGLLDRTKASTLGGNA